jgi:hypothetical protein
MRTQSTFTTPTSGPDRAEPTADTPTEPTAEMVAELRHSLWVDIAEGMLQGCPAPSEFSVHDDASIAHLYLREAGHVAAWAEFLGLRAPEISTQIVSKDTTYRLTVTSTSDYRAGVHWMTDHYHREPIAPEHSAEEPTAGEPGA